MSKKKESCGVCRSFGAVFVALVFILSACVQAVPPVADGNELTVTDPLGAEITLIATDDGLPEQPGKLNYMITSLPEHGWVFDPNDGLEIITTPYTLQNDGNSVIYEPCPYYFAGTDGFTFKANDGGESPDNGDSNTANINLIMNMLSDVLYEVHTGFWDYFPLRTSHKKVRTQTLYHADELGDTAMSISSLALNIKIAPAIELQNWTIRMKHTSQTSYASLGFDNEGWTVVYSGNESITSTGWYDFSLQVPFAYDGVSSLQIDYSFDNPGTNSGYGYVYDSAPTEYRLLLGLSDTVSPFELLTASARYKRLPNLTLRVQSGTDILLSDFNQNCSVGAEDLLTMINTWLAQAGDLNYNSDCDTVVNNRVDLADFAVFASEWLYEIQ